MVDGRDHGTFPAGSPFLKLPEELRIEVLSNLDVKSLLRCRLLCTALRDVVKESMQLQYNIELAADGLVDGTGCNLPVAERYNLLLERRRRWRRLDWKKVDSLSAPGSCQAYELVDGVFASSRGFGFVGSRHLAITRLPSGMEGVHQTERADIGFSARDFAMDPSQDLIALVLTDGPTHHVGLNIVVRLHTLSNNRPHPQAAAPQLNLPVGEHYDRAFIQIVDDVVGMFFWMHDPALVIWNWRTGKVVVNCVESGLLSEAYDFAFLSSRAYMITNTTGSGAINMYAFSGDHDHDTGAPPPPTRVAQLLLPPVQLGQAPVRFYTHSAPFVARPTPGRPFETSPECRLHVMELIYGDRTSRFHLFVHNRYLLSYVPPGMGSGASYEPVVKEWTSWGPDNTRLWPIVGVFQWLRYVHGERMILPAIIHAAPPTPTTATMIMYDFNVHPKRLDDPVALPLLVWHENAVVNYVTSERSVEVETVFEAPVVTRLPFMMVRRNRPLRTPDYSGFMIDHEHLVGMRDVDLAVADLNLEDSNVDLDVFTF